MAGTNLIMLRKHSPDWLNLNKPTLATWISMTNSRRRLCQLIEKSAAKVQEELHKQK